MNTPPTHSSLEALLASIQIPDSAREKAEKRYDDLGKWFKRDASSCKPYSPHVYGQGSFRLGTVIRPLNEKEEFDLDVGCRFTAGIDQFSHTQEQLKEIARTELESYRVANNIKDALEEKHRCWRLQYQDELRFHMDVVPSIPQSVEKRASLAESMSRRNFNTALVQSVAALAGAITDDRNPDYRRISSDWRVSNSEGYALWFESRVPTLLMEKVATARVDKLPERQRGSPLHFCVQILKRHRDVMFEENPDPKPISIIITTLAARAYNGEDDLHAAMRTIVSGMRKHINAREPRVPNPVNPDEEDFADRWSMPEGLRLDLEGHFKKWLQAVERDFGVLESSSDALALQKVASTSFRVLLNEDASKAIARNNALLVKAAVLATGAKTSTAGIIGSTGVSNPPHKFYG